MKLCKDCKHATPRYSTIRFCNRPENIIVSPVDGDDEYDRACNALRDNEKKCGAEAKWFEPKND